MEPVGASGDVWWRGGWRRWAQGAGEAAGGEFVRVNWYHVGKLLREFTVAIMSDPLNYVEELTRRERVAFPRERKSSPLEVCVGGLKLFALRHLKAFRK